MHKKLNLLLLFPVIMIVATAINELWLQSNALFSIISTMGIMLPPQAAMWINRKWGGDKQTYTVYTCVIIIINMLLIGLVSFFIKLYYA